MINIKKSDFKEYMLVVKNGDDFSVIVDDDVDFLINGMIRGVVVSVMDTVNYVIDKEPWGNSFGKVVQAIVKKQEEDTSNV